MTTSYHLVQNAYTLIAGPGNLTANVTVNQPSQIVFAVDHPQGIVVGHHLNLNEAITISSMGSGVSAWAKSELASATALVTLSTDATVTTGASGSGATGGGAGTLIFQDQGTPKGVAATLNVVGANASVAVSGSVATLSVTGASALDIEAAGVDQGTAAVLNVTGGGVSVGVTNGVATINVPTTTLAIYDEGTLSGTATTLNVTGIGASVTVSGSAGTLTIPGTAIYDEGVSKGYASSINFTGKGVTATNANGVATVTIPGNSGDIYLSPSGGDDSANIWNAYQSLYYGGAVGGTIHLDAGTFLLNSSVYTSFNITPNASSTGNGTLVSSPASDSVGPLQDNYIVYYGFEVLPATMTAGGSGYSVGNTITQGSAQIKVLTVNGSGSITSFAVNYLGTTASIDSGATVVPSGGTGATFTLTHIGSSGSGYSSGNIISLTSAQGGAIITVLSVSGGAITSFSISHPGAAGNTAITSLGAGATVSPSGGSGALFVPVYNGTISTESHYSVVMTSPTAFNVISPNPSVGVIASGTVGTIFSNQITFLVSAGGSAYVAGDSFNILLYATRSCIAMQQLHQGMITIKGQGKGTTVLKCSKRCGTFINMNLGGGGAGTMYRLLTLEDFTIDNQFIIPQESSYTDGIVIDLFAATNVQDIFIRRVDTKNSHIPQNYPWKTSVSIIGYQSGSGTDGAPYGADSYVIERILLEDCNFCIANDSGGYGGNYGVQIGGSGGGGSAYRPGTSSPAGYDQWVINIAFNDISIVRCKWDSGITVPLGQTAPTTGFIVGAAGHGARWQLTDCSSSRSWDDDFEMGSCVSLAMTNCTGDTGHYEAFYFTNLGGMPSSQSQVTIVRGCRVLYSYFIAGTTDPAYSPLWVNGAGGGTGIPYGHFILEDFEGAAKFTGGIQAITIDKFTTRGRQPQQTLIATQNGAAMSSGDNYNDILGTLGITITSNISRSNININNVTIDDNCLINYAGYTGCTVSCTALTLAIMHAVNLKISNVKLKNSVAVIPGTSGSGTISWTPILLFYPGSSASVVNQAAGSITRDTFASNSFNSINAYIGDAGLHTDLSVSGGHALCATNSTVEHRYICMGGFFIGTMGPFVDSCWWVGSTPGDTISGHKTGIVLKRLDSRLGGALNYIDCYVSDNGTSTSLNIDLVVNGTRTNKQTSVSGTRITSSTQYWVMASIRGNLITLTYRSSEPTNTLDQGGTGTITTITYTLTGLSEVYKFGADQLGWGGFSWIPMDAGATLSKLSMEALAVIEGPGINDVTIKSAANLDSLTIITYADPSNMDKWARFNSTVNLTNFNLIGANATTALDQTAGLSSGYLQKSRRSGNWLNNPSASAISPSGSPFTYTNSDGYNEDVAVYGGTVTQIEVARNGGAFTQVSAATTNFIIMLNPGDQIRVTYSATPSMNKIPRF